MNIGAGFDSRRAVITHSQGRDCRNKQRALFRTPQQWAFLIPGVNMAKGGRKTLLTPELQKEILKLLCAGSTIEDTCDQVGIDKSTFYNWRNRGSKATAGEFFEFFNATTRAMSTAKNHAVATIRKAIHGHETKEETTETFTETRLDRDGKPYTYTRKTVRVTVAQHAGDWRAAIEFLKRRDPDNWSDRIKVEDWRTQAIADIRAGQIDFMALAEAFDHDLATELFKAAGVPIPTGKGT